MNVCHIISLSVISWLCHHVTAHESHDLIYYTEQDRENVRDQKYKKVYVRPAMVPRRQLQKPLEFLTTEDEFKVTKLRDEKNLNKFGGQKQQAVPKKLTVTDELFFELEILDYHGMGKHLIGNVTIACFGGLTPITCLNFVSITKGFRKGKNRLTYMDGLVTKVVRDFMVQMGDTNEGSNDSIFGKNFADESFAISHNHAGWVGMANFGKDSNGSQFYVLLRTARWLDGKHVIFGKVINGMDIIQKIGERDTDMHNIPLSHVKIINCGSLKLKKPYSLDESQFNTDGDIERIEGDEI